MFVRVRSAGVNDPAHEFDVAEGELNARPSLYLVVDSVPVPAPRPVKYVARSEPRKKKSKNAPAGDDVGEVTQ